LPELPRSTLWPSCLRLVVLRELAAGLRLVVLRELAAGLRLVVLRELAAGLRLVVLCELARAPRRNELFNTGLEPSDAPELCRMARSRSLIAMAILIALRGRPAHRARRIRSLRSLVDRYSAGAQCCSPPLLGCFGATPCVLTALSLMGIGRLRYAGNRSNNAIVVANQSHPRHLVNRIRVTEAMRECAIPSGIQPG